MSKGYHKQFRKSHRHREFDLPEAIIQVVQSFLTSKEAAQTTILSRSWQGAWLTRPNIDFNHTDFCRQICTYFGLEEHEHHKFLDFAEKTLGRYENSKLKIDSFRLSLIDDDSGYGRTPRLIHRALKLGPTHLTFEAEGFNLHLEIPDEVLRYENLLSLNVTMWGINLDQELCCSRLQFFSLESAKIKSLDTIFHVLKSCPLIEKLSLCRVDVGGDSGMLQQTIINRHRLKSLVLKYVNFDTTFLALLSSKFPSLKDLTLHIGKDREEILISSPTLERLDFSMAGYTVQMVKLDVPSIRKLAFECISIPDEVCVTSNSRGWECYVNVTSRITSEKRPTTSASWFDRLSHFIRKWLSFSSRVSLSLHVNSHDSFDYEPGEIRGLPISEIEYLDIYHVHLPTLSCYALFDGLFRMCRPKVITQIMPYNDHSITCPEANNIRFLGKRLSDALDAKISTPGESQFMYGLNDLKEARIEVFDEEIGKWRSEKTIDDALSNYKYLSVPTTPGGYRHQKVRFRLYWKL